jgi:hypothetical protein
MFIPPEAFLAYLWQFQAFDRANLRTEQGEAVQVLHAGQPNAHAGADFTQARVVVGEVEWAGTVELHRRSSDWFGHSHQTDAAYETVILHVVWQHDAPVFRRDGTEIPTMALASRTDPTLLNRYQALLDAREPIPCAPQFVRVSPLTRLSMLDKALMQRLEARAARVRDLWETSGKDWEETAWQVVAGAFGGPLNAEPMARLARMVALKRLQKHRGNPLQLESLLFGAAGLLPAEPDEYAANLRREFGILGAKYGLVGREIEPHVWKFLRLRPVGFPTIRLAQLAALVNAQPNLFALFTQTDSLEGLREKLAVHQSAYWQTHYVWGKPAAKPVPTPGQALLDHLVINAAVPLLTALARERGQTAALDRAVAWLEALPAEKNTLTATWRALGLRVKTAFDSQGAIEWHHAFCARKQCLRCAVGVALLKEQ